MKIKLLRLFKKKKDISFVIKIYSIRRDVMLEVYKPDQHIIPATLSRAFFLDIFGYKPVWSSDHFHATPVFVERMKKYEN